MKQETKQYFLKIRLNKSQMEELKYKAYDAGFKCVSEYTRFQLFLSTSHINKIDKIYEVICNNNELLSKKMLQTNAK